MTPYHRYINGLIKLWFAEAFAIAIYIVVKQQFFGAFDFEISEIVGATINQIFVWQFIFVNTFIWIASIIDAYKSDHTDWCVGLFFVGVLAIIYLVLRNRELKKANNKNMMGKSSEEGIEIEH